MNKKNEIAADSMIVTFLVEANHDEYDSDLDISCIKNERAATYRIATTYGLLLLPTVDEEVRVIPNTIKNFDHLQIRNVLLRRTNLNYPEFQSKINSRMKELFLYHRKWKDCRVLAEAEAVGVEVLLTFDDTFQKRLRTHTSVQLLKPTQFVVSPEDSFKFKPERFNPFKRNIYKGVSS